MLTACRPGNARPAQKLVKVPGSVCSGCYAMKGNYTRFPAIRESQYKRLKAIRHPLWVKAMTAKINSIAVSKHKFFRWHDAGDVQDLRHLAKIFEICRRTPAISHWMPTREAWTKPYIDRAPSNLVIRFSGTMIGQATSPELAAHVDSRNRWIQDLQRSG